MYAILDYDVFDRKYLRIFVFEYGIEGPLFKQKVI